MLYDVAGGEGPFPSEGNVREALEQLDVTLACVGDGKDADRVVEIYEAAGLSQQADGRLPDLSGSLGRFRWSRPVPWAATPDADHA